MSDMTKRRVRLYGVLGSTFGRDHELVVATPAQAIRALCVLIPGFEHYLNSSRRRGLVYAVFSGRRNISADDLNLDGSVSDIRIVPVIIGSKRAGMLQVIIGAVLVVAGYFTFGATSSIGMAMIASGVSMAAGGVVQMLSPQMTGLAKSSDEKASYAFGSPTNTASQGYPVPLLYGKRRIGGAIISAGIYVDDLDAYQAQRASGTVTPDARGAEKGDLQSIAVARVLVALGEGEFAGGLTDRDIYLNGTALVNSDGTSNFGSGVSWVFRPGTQDQEYIPGIPSVENEISAGSVEVTTAKSWVHTLTNNQLSAVRLRLKWPSLFHQKDDGGIGGYRVEYAIDLQVDGGSWQTVVTDAADGRAMSGYERTHRVALPSGAKTWTVRVRRLSADTTDDKIGSIMTLESYTEIIDAKFRYPHTALLYLEFDASTFSGQIPTITCEPQGRIVSVPSNYTPETRTYLGTWDGTFKQAWTDNPAWIFYDIVVSERFGLGQRLSAANTDRYELYRVAQYCDALVPDGLGGSGTEVRYKCDVYIQTREDAFTVLRDFASMFRGLTCWYNNQLVALADMPRDMDWTFTRANVVDGLFTYAGSTVKSRYSTALVTYSDPDNAWQNAVEAVFENDLVSRFDVNQLELSAVGCSRRSEANRRGRWAVLTSNGDRTVEFKVGLDGNIPLPGYVVGVADEMFSGRVTGGRISAVNGRSITLDRVPGAAAGDRLILNLPSGVAQSRTIESVTDRTVTVSTVWSETPEVEAVWVVEADDLYVQQYRIVSVTDNNDGTFTISGVHYDPDKFARIDDGATIPNRPDSVLPINTQSAPANILISETSAVSQGLSVATMHVTWDKAAGAIAYEAQWRRDSSNWISVPRSSVTGFDITGIYAGQYLVRVCAINVADVASTWAYSAETTLTGKQGNPPVPVALRATMDRVFAVELTWGFGEDAGDTSYTEIQYATRADYSDATLLSDVAYPTHNYLQSGLAAGVAFYYRARLVDKLGNQSDWTEWVQGASSSDASDILGDITDAIENSQAWQEMNQQIDPLAEASIENALANDADIQRWRKANGKVVAQIVEIRTTVADQGEAFAQFERTVGAQFNDMSAAVDTKATAKFDATGQGFASWDTGAQVTYNGKTVSAGLSIYAEVDGGSITAGVLIKAEQFALMQPSGSGWLSPFAVKNQQVFINQGFIEDGTITNEKIGNYIQSVGYDGRTGWRIDKGAGFFFGAVDSAGVGSIRLDETGLAVMDGAGTERCKLGRL
ncbi:TipJ family phage tail tip protein [Pantoea agglomerans]|uniref:TipJ family phage tail tip protein n=1 Tax=Enterobacter agglomerans TaxID=549 RepID=UPI002413CB5B|nr:DUF1983 domain-containing protein [Pantoea agglomerans]